jgi:hypothetical protein
MAPDTLAAFQDSDIIALANNELQSRLANDLISMREDFFLRSKTVSISSNISRYAMPERALGNSLKDVFYVDSNSNKFPLRKINIHDISTNSASGGYPLYFFLQGDYINIQPIPSSASGSLEIWYYERPNELVLTASCAKITSIATNGANKEFTVNTDLSSSLSTGNYVDFLSGKSPFVTWSIDVPIVSISSTVITVATSNVLDQASSSVLAQVNDYICPAQKANIPMIPQEAHPLLSEMVQEKIVQAWGDGEKLAQIKASIIELRKQLFNICQNRVENANELAINRRGFNRMIGPGW